MCLDYYPTEWFSPEYEDEAVSYTYHDGTLNLWEKKELIMCWFDYAYGNQSNTLFDVEPQRRELARWLKKTGFKTIEAFLEYGQPKRFDTS